MVIWHLFLFTKLLEKKRRIYDTRGNKLGNPFNQEGTIPSSAPVQNDYEDHGKILFF